MNDRNLFLQGALDELRRNGLHRSLKDTRGPQSVRVRVAGKDVINFCSNNYLGLADDPRLAQAAWTAMGEEGFGAGASRLVCGNFSAHQRLEQHLARFKNTESCLLFSTGYMANVGIIAGFCSPGDIIFSDRFNHASIIDGIFLSRAQWKRYPHKDIPALEKMLKQSAKFKKRIIVTDTVFSMDGDIAPLPEIVSLAERYDAWVMVDEAHALGVLGEQGKGAVEHFGLERKIPIQMGTLSKAVGAFGAYCCGSRELIDFLVNKARSFIYTTAMPPGVAAAAHKGLEILAAERERRERLWQNARCLREGLRKAGFNILETETPIIPVLLKEDDLAVRFAEELLASGIFAVAIRPPTVPPRSARLRLTVTSAHQPEDIQACLHQIERIGKKLCVL